MNGRGGLNLKPKRYQYLFHRDKSYYNGSLAYYQIEMMVTVLAQDMGVRYNSELIESGALADLESTRFFADFERFVPSWTVIPASVGDLRLDACLGRCYR